MDRTTRCLHCGKRLVPIPTLYGRRPLVCIRCIDPTRSSGTPWANSPLAPHAAAEPDA